MDGTRITGTERKGNYLIMLVALSTERGKEIMGPFLTKKKLTMNNIINTMTLMLAFDEWCSRKKFKWELDNCESAVSYLLESIKKHLPLEVKVKEKGSKEAGCNGYHKIKFHAIWLFIVYMRKYGSSVNFDSSYGEEHHRWAVNRTGKRTQHRYNSFVHQTCTRDSENTLIRHVFKFIKDQCPKDCRHLYEQSRRDMDERFNGDVSASTEQLVLLGRYTLYCEPVWEEKANKQETKFSHLWANKKRIISGIGLHSDVYHGLSSYSDKPEIQYTDFYTVEGYTSLTVQSDGGNVIYRASESYHGKKRYDWALIEDPVTGSTYIGQ